MINIFKPYEGSATPSGQNDFRKAVISLTAYYTLGVFAVLVMFNLLVYFLFANSIRYAEHEEAEEYSISEGFEAMDEARTQAIQDDLAKILLISDVWILILAVVVSYGLSRRTLAPLEQAHQRQARFIADAAHELRTPLAAMKAGSEVMLRSNRTIPEYAKFINEHLEEVNRLATLSDDLLFLAHDGRKADGAMSEVDLSEICRKQIDMLGAYAAEKDVATRIDVEDGVFIIGRKDDLVRLVLNLLKNAIDYNKQGGLVILSLRKKGKKARLLIEDSGIGIAKEDLPYIFERFYKANDSRSRNSSGAGLGLAMAKEIIEKHGGAITVNSVPGKGSVFEVVFPVA